MEILRDDQVPNGSDLKTYRETAWNSLLFGIFFLAAAAAAGVAAIPVVTQTWMSVWTDLACGFGALIPGFIGAIGIKGFRASRRPESWLVRHSSNALYLRFRFYHNWRFPADTPSVVRLDRREVSWVRALSKRLSLRGEQGEWTSEKGVRMLEIGLRQVDTAPLKAALAEEAKRRDRRGVRTNHFPVTLHGDATVRVELRRPAALLRDMPASYRVLASGDEGGKSFADMSRDEKEAHILDLVQSGNKISAIAAARELYGYDLAAAKDFVEGLVEG